jgi:hypothetical protein
MQALHMQLSSNSKAQLTEYSILLQSRTAGFHNIYNSVSEATEEVVLLPACEPGVWSRGEASKAPV